MLNIHELERAWLKYKIRTFLPTFAAMITTLVLIVAVFFMLPLTEIGKLPEPVTEVQQPAVSPIPNEDSAQSAIKKPKPSEANSTNLVAKNTPNPEPVISKQPLETAGTTVEPPLPVEKQSTSVVLKPSLQFMRTIEEEVTTHQDYKTQDESIPDAPSPSREEKTESGAEVAVKPDKTVERPAEKPAESLVVQTDSTPKKVQEPATVPTEEKAQITIITKEDADDLKDVLRRFSKNKNPALSLFVAKRYYDMKLYQKAYNYALITNEIDNGIEDSWLIFAKSLVKLDQKEKAIETLQSYVNHSHSMKAKILLDDIRKGSFK